MAVSPPKRLPQSQPARAARPAEGGRIGQNEPRVSPHNADAEMGLLAAIIIDEDGSVLDACLKDNITPAYFYRSAHQYIYAAMLALRAKGAALDEIVLANELRARKELDACGGHAYLYEITNRVQTTVGAKGWREIVREQYFLRQLIRTSQWTVEQAYGASQGSSGELLASIRSTFERIEHDMSGNGAVSRGLFDAVLTKDNPNNLLGTDDFLERGGVLLTISLAGVGKSSWTFQSAATWALGRPFFGIQASQKMRVLIVQAEDSDRYRAKCTESLRQAWNLTPAEGAELHDRVKVARIKGVAGDEFLAQVGALAKKHEADLVYINPISNYILGDGGKAEVATQFFNGLDRINDKDRWAYILIHHTGKPPKADAKVDNSEDWAGIYMGFGSSVFANRPRAGILLQPRVGMQGEFWMHLGKGGMNAGVVKEVEHGVGVRLEPTIKIAIRHSTQKMKMPWGEMPMYLWEPSDAAPDPAKKGERSGRGRPSKYNRESVLQCFPKRENAKSALQVMRFVQEIEVGMTPNTFNAIRHELMKDGKVFQTEDGENALFFRA